MPIAIRKPTEVPAVKPAPITVEKSQYKDVVVDDSETPIESMVAYLSGMPWPVDYYSQLLGEHSDLRELDPGANAAFQQYTKTVGLELRVDSALSSSYDTEGGITTVNGSAVIVHVVPNIKDYFIADAGMQEKGLFNVTNVERLTFGRNSAYRIDYTLSSYARDNSELASNLEAKVVSTYHFSKERLAEGLAPVLQEDDYNDSVTLSRRYQETIVRFFRSFFNRATMLLLVPNGSVTTYDFGLCNFLTMIMDSSEAPEINDISYIPTDNDRYLGQGNLWTALIDRNYDDLSRIHSKACLAPSTYFNHSSWLKTAVYWNIAKYVYPVITKDELAIAGLNSPPYTGTADFVTADARMEVSPYLEKNSYQVAEKSVPLIKSVLIDDSYVLSQDFYTGGPNLSVLEILVRDYLKCQQINLKMLSALIQRYPDWPALERFYYGPILILLMKDAIKGFYK